MRQRSRLRRKSAEASDLRNSEVAIFPRSGVPNPWSALSLGVSKGAGVNCGRNSWKIPDDPSIRRYRSFEIRRGDFAKSSSFNEGRRPSSSFLEIQKAPKELIDPFTYSFAADFNFHAKAEIDIRHAAVFYAKVYFPRTRYRDIDINNS